MVRVEFRRWFFDTKLYHHTVSFFKNRVWFGWWWASVCSAHGDGFDGHCGMCTSGAWTRTHLTLDGSMKNSHWAFGTKLNYKTWYED